MSNFCFRHSLIFLLNLHFVKEKFRNSRQNYLQCLLLFKRMEEEAKNLNYECNYNIYLIKTLRDRNFKSQNDRHKIILWIKKIQQCDLTFEEMLLRNEFIYHLLTCVKNGELRPPFNDVPPSEPLSKLQNLLPSPLEKAPVNTDWVEDLEKADSNIPDIYRKSPDGGAFLSQQPIPKCGAFCYLAIVNKPLNNSE